jgi:hypothetical protein
MIMAELTAQILVNGSYLLLLQENDRPNWQCIALHRRGEREHDTRPTITWIPSKPENIFKDGLLMIAIHCLADEEIIKRAKSMSKEIMNAFVDIGSLTNEQLAELHTMNRKHSDRCSNCQNAQHPATRKLMFLDITIFGNNSAIGGPETQKELKQHHASASVGYTEFVKGTERIR